MEFSIDLVAALIGMGADELKKHFTVKDGETEKQLEGAELDAKVKELAKAHEGNILEAGRKSGARDRMTNFEQELRTKYGVTTKAEREHLVEAILNAKTSEANAEIERLKGELNAKKSAKLEDLPIEEQKKFIVNHSFFNEQIESLVTEAQKRADELEQFKKQVEQRQVSGKLREIALDYLHNEYRAVLPENAEIAKTLTDAFLDNLEKSAVWKVENDNILPFDTNTGERILSNYKPVDAKQYLEVKVKNWFTQHPADPNKAAPGKNPGTGQSGVAIPDWRTMTKDQIFQTVLNEQDPARAAELERSAAAFLG